MNQKFAKLFEDTEVGQILVLRQTNDEDLDVEEIRIFFMPKELGVCSMALMFTKEKRFDAADKAFEDITVERLVETVKKTMGHILADLPELQEEEG